MNRAQQLTSSERIHATVRKHWGFDTYRPLQEEAMAAALENRDSVVVMPTGGGKSLCYQAPAAMHGDGVTLVVSPLIALMKDQVDRLNARGIVSALFNSTLNAQQRREVEAGIMGGRYRLLYIAPERFPDTEFLDLLRSSGVRSVAVDEAHCISHWGHDFRPDYRRLSELKNWFPGIGVHAFTATATPRVREDIAEQLCLEDPAVLVGDFDRPNLTYRMKWRSDLRDQVGEIIDGHRASAGIIYCIRRIDVDNLAGYLGSCGYRALPYHAGMNAETRKLNQEAFLIGEADIIVATIAFGMGIDRADIRYIIHTALPQSIEAYQQETGRAGRDGLPAECTLFYTGGDFMIWKSIFEKNESQYLEHRLIQLNEVFDFCKSAVCRHRSLVKRFGQEYEKDSCGACDVCLDELPLVADGNNVAMKILSAVAKTGGRYGAKYVTDVLIGAENELIGERGHETLSVIGLLEGENPRSIRAWIDQLADQACLLVGTEYRTFSVTPRGWEVMRGEREVTLRTTPAASARQRTKKRRTETRDFGSRQRSVVSSTSEVADAEPVNVELFEALRVLRKELADGKGLPAYCVATNKALDWIARLKPTDENGLLAIPGIGPKLFAQYGEAILSCVRRHGG